jgi:hypothetical protein
MAMITSSDDYLYGRYTVSRPCLGAFPGNFISHAKTRDNSAASRNSDVAGVRISECENRVLADGDTLSEAQQL